MTVTEMIVLLSVLGVGYAQQDRQDVNSTSSDDDLSNVSLVISITSLSLTLLNIAWIGSMYCYHKKKSVKGKDDITTNEDSVLSDHAPNIYDDTQVHQPDFTTVEVLHGDNSTNLGAIDDELV